MELRHCASTAAINSYGLQPGDIPYRSVKHNFPPQLKKTGQKLPVLDMYWTSREDCYPKICQETINKTMEFPSKTMVFPPKTMVFLRF